MLYTLPVVSAWLLPLCLFFAWLRNLLGIHGVAQGYKAQRLSREKATFVDLDTICIPEKEDLGCPKGDTEEWRSQVCAPCRSNIDSLVKEESWDF